MWERAGTLAGVGVAIGIGLVVLTQMDGVGRPPLPDSGKTIGSSVERLQARADLLTARGDVPAGALRRAIAVKSELQGNQKAVANADGHWEPYGIGELIDGDMRQAGRVDNFSYDPENHRLFAAVGTGGIWMSEAVDGDVTTLADHWVSVGDLLPSQINGAVIWTPAQGGTLIAAGGESAMGNTGYMGLGTYWTDDLGESWHLAEGFPDGAQVYNADLDPSNPNIVYVASTKGLFRSEDAGRSFSNLRLPTAPDCAGVEDVGSACQFANFVTDVVVQHPAGATGISCSDLGCPVLAAVGWRSGQKPFLDGSVQGVGNGLYRSADGTVDSFERLHVSADRIENPLGFHPEDRLGRIELGIATGPDQDHSYVYALVQDSVNFNEGLALLGEPLDDVTRLPLSTAVGGLYVSPDFGDTWTRMADPIEIGGLSGSFSFLAGVQAWYNEWVEVDPTRHLGGVPTRMTFGLEEVFQNRTESAPIPLNGTLQLGPADFEVIGQYSAITAPTTTHPDQHAGLYVPTGDGGVCLFVGNDGGVFKQCAAAGERMDNRGWGTGSSTGMYTLLPYGLAVAKDGTVWWGLQDNGSGHIEPDTREQIMDFGADGFYAEVDPDNSEISYTESQNGGLRRTTNRGQSSSGIAPPYTEVNFANWFVMDPLDAQHMVTAAQEIFETLEAETVTSGGWIEVFNLGMNRVTGAPNTTTSLRTIGEYTYAGFCGSCGHTSDTLTFQNGIATNVAGDQPALAGTGDGWHFAAASGLDNRQITGIDFDPEHPETVYVTLAGYVANIVPPGHYQDANPNLGTGNVFRSSDAGETFVDISGDLPRVEADTIVIRNGQLIVGTDIGAFISSDLSGSDWAPLGSGLPSVPVNYLRLRPGAEYELFAATFGRGIWRYTFPDGEVVEPPDMPGRGGTGGAFGLLLSIPWLLAGLLRRRKRVVARPRPCPTAGRRAARSTKQQSACWQAGRYSMGSRVVG